MSEIEAFMEQHRLHPGDELVVTFTADEWVLLTGLFNDAFNNAQTQRQRDKARKVRTMIVRKAEKLTLAWLDKKLAEFP